MIQNPVYEQLTVELALEESQARSLESRQQEVEAKFSEAHQQLTALNLLEAESASLERRVEVARQEFDIYARKRGEARVIDELGQHAISDVVVSQPASLQLRKHSPRGSIILPIGLAFAAFAALLAVLIADRKNLIGFSSPAEIEEALNIPVLATIPRVHSSRVAAG
jgi:uncharacterized protein involved in exopolysaccharide biosynthesis